MCGLIEDGAPLGVNVLELWFRGGERQIRFSLRIFAGFRRSGSEWERDIPGLNVSSRIMRYVARLKMITLSLNHQSTS